MEVKSSQSRASASPPLYAYEPVSPSAPQGGQQTDLGQLSAALARGGWWIALWAAIAVALGVAYLLLETPLYEATSEIIIDTNTSREMQSTETTSAVATADTIDSNLVDSQVEVLGSDGFALRVIRELDLVHDPEFTGTPDRLFPWIISFVLTKVSNLENVVGLQGHARDDPEQRALAVFDKRLTVKRTALTYVIAIRFESDNSYKAAKIANAVANTYLQTVLESKYAAARHTAEWLENRLTEMRKQALSDDRAVEEYKAKNNIVDTNRGLMNEQELADLNSQLIIAKAATAEAKAKLDNARSVLANTKVVTTFSDALTNPVISRLQAQYLDLANRSADLSARYGPTHGAVVALKRQMTEIKNSIQAEVKRIADSYENDYKVALARQNSLEASLKGVVSENAPTNLAQATLNDLESSSDASRALLNGYLQKAQEAYQLQTFPVSDARVVTEAIVPLKPTNPKGWLVIAIGLVGGLVLGAGATSAREFLSTSFGSAAEVEAVTGLPCLGVLPVIRPKWIRSGWGDGRNNDEGFRVANPVDAYVKEAPFSRFAETLRGVKVTIDGATGDAGSARVIGIVSAGSNEGKTTVAANLAMTIGLAGAKTLLIDCDFRTRALTSRLAPNSKVGLLEAIADPEQLEAFIIHDRGTGVSMLPCGPSWQVSEVAAIFGGEGMGRLLERARETFEYVVLDLAPVVPVVDARAISRHLDGHVFVIRWASTSKRMVKEAIAMEEVGSRVFGTVLSMVDWRILRKYEKYRGPGAYSYYHEQTRDSRVFASTTLSQASGNSRLFEGLRAERGTDAHV